MMSFPGKSATREVYEETTREILVRVSPAYLPDQSDPTQAQFTWAYTVEIENLGDEAVQLLSRHWIITDGRGRIEEVKGPGVVGVQPTLGAKEAFRYTSGCPLTTPSGDMSGAYQMITASGERFEARIPPFSLHMPEAKRRLN
jgi:ApaG protein